jgi:hypothetical protein
MNEFGLGYIPQSDEVLKGLVKAHTIELEEATGITIPKSFDARAVRQNQTACNSFKVLDQGACGSCYAFAVGTALSSRRLCRDSDRIWNVVVSPKVICQHDFFIVGEKERDREEVMQGTSPAFFRQGIVSWGFCFCLAWS